MIPELFELINLNISQHAPTTLALPASNYVTNTFKRARKAAQVHVDRSPTCCIDSGQTETKAIVDHT